MESEPGALPADVPLDLRALASNEERFRVLFSEGPAPQMFATLEGTIVAANKAFCALLLYEPAELLGRATFDLLPSDERAECARLLEDLVARTIPSVQAEKTFFRSTGDAVPVLVSVGIVASAGGDRYVSVTAQDLSERKRTDQLLEAEQRFLDDVLRDAPLEQACDALLRAVETAVPGAVASLMVSTHQGSELSLLSAPSMPEAFKRAVATVPIAAGAGCCGSAAFRREVVTSDILHDDDWTPWRDDASAAGYRSCWSRPIIEAATGHVLGTFALYFPGRLRLVPAQVELLRRFEKLAEVAVVRRRRQQLLYEDERTGLGTRPALADALRRLLGDPDARPGAVLVADVRGFRRIAVALGEPGAAAALRAIVARLRVAIGTDADGPYTIGGAKFGVVPPLGATQAELEDLAGRMHFALVEPIEVGGDVLEAAVAIGAATTEAVGRDPEALVDAAETAAHGAKQEHDDALVFYASDYAITERRRWSFADELRRAIDAGGIGLEYQPKVLLPDGPLRGVECLARWTRADGERVPPSEFIPLAENSGQMHRITEAVFRVAAQQWRTWQEHGLTTSLAVNVSAEDLRSEHLLPTLAEALRAIPSRNLEIEITETAVIDDFELALGKLTRLRAAGVRVAVDDFGVGNSSLSYLKRLPIDVIKIDRTFLSGITEHDRDRQLLGGIIKMAEALGLATVAEGAESRGQIEVLHDLGCEEGQGFAICPPVSGDEILARYRP